MRTHEAGAMHAERYGGGGVYLPYPQDVNELLRMLWPASIERGADGILRVAGLDVVSIAREFGTPVYVIDEDDFRSRARAFREEFTTAFADVCGGAEVYYAGKAFLCTEVARWVAEEGLGLDVSTGGELAVAQRAGFPGERIAMHGNNKSSAEIEQALRYGVGRIIIDSFDEIDRIDEVASRLGVVAPAMIRVTVGVEAHTHEFIATAHEDQKFGLSVATGAAAEAARRIVSRPDTMVLLGLHSHIGSQIFDTGGFEVSARRLINLHAEIEEEHGIVMPHLDLGGGYGIAYTSEHTPLTPEQLAQQMADLARREFKALAEEDGDGVRRQPPIVSIEPGRAIAGPSAFTVYEVGTIKPVVVNERVTRAYVAVDGGMSDNIRAALYEADYSCTLASRRSDAEPMLSRVVGKHCESGDIVVLDEYLPADLRPGDLIAVPGTGAYCRSLSSQYNHTPRPPVVAVRDGRARLIVRRETIDDLLALDVG